MSGHVDSAFWLLPLGLVVYGGIIAAVIFAARWIVRQLRR